MIKLSNAHTHTTYCDGTNTPEQMVLSAIARGFDALGFSGHAYTPFDDDYTMNPQSTVSYIAEIARLKEVYKDQIAIFCGIEDDRYCRTNLLPFDYTIGSCHYVFDPSCGKNYSIDNTPEELKKACDQAFSGDIYALIEQYFTSMVQLAESGRYTILGHFDLIRKFNHDNRFFDEENPTYRTLAKQALRKCAETGILIEVNTGGICRGYRSSPYPAPWLLTELAQLYGRVIITSDAHDAASLSFYFKETAELLRECGFDKHYRLTPQGFCVEKL